MMNHLLSDFGESCRLGKNWYIAVHFAIHLYAFHHVLAIGFQSTVEIMQVIYTRSRTRRSVKQFCRDGFRQRIVAFLLPARNQIISFLLYHTIKFRNFIWTVLQISVHCYDHIALRLFEAAEQSRRLAIIASEFDALHPRIGFTQSHDLVPRAVGAPVVHENHLIRERVLVHHLCNPSIKFGQRLFFVI